MKVYYELNLESFEAWSGAVETLDRIKTEGKCEELENILEDIYPDGMDETELNDLLWFESETVFEWLGISDKEDEEKEIEDCGNYGYIEEGECFVIYKWEYGWQETGLSFACTEEEARHFCEEYNGYNLNELIEEMNI